MLLTKQQKYLLAVLERLGCAEQRQLAALLQKAFAFSSLDDAMRVTNACVRQMQMGGLLQISDNIVSHCGERAVSQQIEAIDVMLELSAAQPESFYAVDKHTLLRFSLGAASFKQFVIVSGSDPPPEHEIRQDEKIIVLLPDDIRPETFPYTRPAIFAIRQKSGTHRFFARKLLLQEELHMPRKKAEPEVLQEETVQPEIAKVEETVTAEQPV